MSPKLQPRHLSRAEKVGAWGGTIYMVPPPKDLGSHILIYNQVDGAHSLRLMGWV